MGYSPAEDHLYRLTFDGSIADENGFVVMGGQADKVSEAVAAGWQGELDFAGAIRLAVAGLVADQENHHAAGVGCSKWPCWTATR